VPTFGSLFAGIGGIDLGLERAGWTGRWQVEWDEYCQHVLAHHWPDIPRYGDITTVDWSTVESVDLLAGGFPCQPVSSAGKKAAQADERWLWPEFARAIGALRPELVLVENVTNLLGVNEGSAFGDVLGDLASLGYDAEWDCIPASSVGALHDRDRVWIVAYARCVRVQPDRGSRQAPRASGATQGGARERQRSWNAPSDGGADARAVAHPNGHRLSRSRLHARSRRPDEGTAHVEWTGTTPADSDRGRCESGIGRQGIGRVPVFDALRDPRSGGIALGDADITSADALAAGGGPRGATSQPGWWLTEPDVGRVAHGVPARVDRLRALGNAVVPQVVEVIGQRLIEVIERAA
jgi:DNA (cytosine-5)-methyltransferase 1